MEEFTAPAHELKLQTKSGRGLIEQTGSRSRPCGTRSTSFGLSSRKRLKLPGRLARAWPRPSPTSTRPWFAASVKSTERDDLIADESVRALETSIERPFPAAIVDPPPVPSIVSS